MTTETQTQYAKLSGEKITRTIDIGQGVFLDVDENGAPVGIEVIGPMSMLGAAWLIVRASNWERRVTTE